MTSVDCNLLTHWYQEPRIDLGGVHHLLALARPTGSFATRREISTLTTGSRTVFLSLSLSFFTFTSFMLSLLLFSLVLLLYSRSPLLSLLRFHSVYTYFRFCHHFSILLSVGMALCLPSLLCFVSLTSFHSHSLLPCVRM